MAGGQLEYAPYEAPSRPTSGSKVKVTPTRWARFKRWFKTAFCCCLRADEVTVPVRPPTPPSSPAHGSTLPVYDPTDSEAAPPPLYRTPGGMTMWDPASGTPCPHLLTTQHPRTGEKTCCHCKLSLSA